MVARFLLLALLLMPATVSHALSMTTPDDPAYENQPKHWNSGHAVTLNISATEIFGLFSNANGISFGLSNSSITASYTVPATGAFLTTAMASNRGSDFVQATAAFAGTNASGTINSTGISVSVAAPVGGAVNFSAGTTSSNIGSVVFSNSNGVSFGLNASTITATVKTDYLTTAMASNRGSDFVQATAAFAGTSASGTINSTGISVSIGPYITTADLSQNSSKYVQNWKLTGNTAGTTSSAQGTDLWFSGGNSITVSGSSNSIVLSVGNYITTAMASDRASDFVAATAAFAGTNASGTINSTGISVSIAAPGGAAVATLSYWEHPGGPLVGTTVLTAGVSTLLVFPFVLEDYVSASYIRMPASFSPLSTSFATSAVPWNTTFAQSNTLWAVFYSQGTGASSRSIRYVTSASAGWTYQVSATGAVATNNWTVSQLFTWPQEGANTNATTLNYASTLSTVNVHVSNNLTNFSGVRHLDIPFAGSMSPGNYWIAIARATATGGGKGDGVPMSLIGVSQTNVAIGNLGAATNNTLWLQPGLGSWTTNSVATTTSSMALASISSMANQPRLSFAFMRQA